MKKSAFQMARKIALHLLFWIGVWFLYIYFFHYNSEDRPYVIWFSSLLMPVTIAVTYTLSYFLIPRFLLEKKYGKFVLYTFYVVLASSYWIVLIIYGCLIFLKKWDASNIPPMIKNFFFVIILVYLVAGLVSFITILNHNFRTAQKNKELQNKILEAQLQLKDQELQYLKMQIHPHFLFNTLNTIYGLSMKRSAQTPDVILKLSNLLDYILYQVSKPGVSVQEEIEHIREYTELERIRFKETLKTSFHADSIDPDIQIAPMLMIPLVENAFKHGSIVGGFLSVDTTIQYNNGTLTLSVKNSFLSSEENGSKEGIGISNLKKRLEMHYPGAYELKNSISEHSYISTLVIFNLDNNHG